MLHAEEECGKFVDCLKGRQEVLQEGTCLCLHLGFTTRSGAYVRQPSFGTLETPTRPSDDYWDFGNYEKSWGNILPAMETFTVEQGGKRIDFFVSGIQFCYCAAHPPPHPHPHPRLSQNRSCKCAVCVCPTPPAVSSRVIAHTSHGLSGLVICLTQVMQTES